ncbi:hypothetical protein BATDEDRAFT_36295 [Batrachochytrium dendrobatidis JAM81]|uniref:PX domain-containing protein n=1 Tax=Batrachochytrium dendrobatidis (strain JAM81 / FGSC 10211) TaxID=684364 RepID=F4PER0_BATDJ|nr:uncharacterized protein BATDEDRAFT_36295 [Batrachochytrium dendrobatidis JAM81]EGF76255.1 hypothetical protein BATDEDRAFT_36295 [Batrachochytrium dendrobatidis JAM81]|eukprot:XP_006683078.1 hypothetical protein BATDEDRAFT_36295 [Batrachochytrium dendrobatidis JAM81]
MLKTLMPSSTSPLNPLDHHSIPTTNITTAIHPTHSLLNTASTSSTPGINSVVLPPSVLATSMSASSTLPTSSIVSSLMVDHQLECAMYSPAVAAMASPSPKYSVVNPPHLLSHNNEITTSIPTSLATSQSLVDSDDDYASSRSYVSRSSSASNSYRANPRVRRARSYDSRGGPFMTDDEEVDMIAPLAPSVISGQVFGVVSESVLPGGSHAIDPALIPTSAAFSRNNSYQGFAIDPEARSFYLDNLWESHRHVFSSHGRSQHRPLTDLQHRNRNITDYTGVNHPCTVGTDVESSTASSIPNPQFVTFPSLPARRHSISSSHSSRSVVDYPFNYHHRLNPATGNRAGYQRLSLEVSHDSLRGEIDESDVEFSPLRQQPPPRLQPQKGILQALISLFNGIPKHVQSNAIQNLEERSKTTYSAYTPLSRRYSSDSLPESIDSQVTPRPSRRQNRSSHQPDSISQPGGHSGIFPFRHDTNFTKDNLIEDGSDSQGSSGLRNRSVLTWQQNNQYRGRTVSTSYDDRPASSNMSGVSGYSPTRSVRSDNGFRSHTMLRLPSPPRRAVPLTSSNPHIPEVVIDESGLSSFPNYDTVSHRAPQTEFMYSGSASRHVVASNSGIASNNCGVGGSSGENTGECMGSNHSPHRQGKGHSRSYTSPQIHIDRPNYMRNHDFERQVPLVYYRLGICVTVSDPLIPTTLNSLERFFTKYTVYPVTVRLLKPRVVGFINVRPVAYTLYKRYKDFRILYTLLAREFRQEFKSLPEFPKKLFFDRYNPLVVSHRLRVFNELLTFVTLHPVYSKTPAVIKFLDPLCVD